MTIIEQLKKKYDKQVKLVKYPRALDDLNPTIYLFQRWAYRVRKNYYGFDLDGAPFIWGQVVDEFLEWLGKKRPDFRIKQCAIKFGRLKFYVDYDQFLNSKREELVNKMINELCDWLYHEKLVY